MVPSAKVLYLIFRGDLNSATGFFSQYIYFVKSAFVVVLLYLSGKLAVNRKSEGINTGSLFRFCGTLKDESFCSSAENVAYMLISKTANPQKYLVSTGRRNTKKRLI